MTIEALCGWLKAAVWAERIILLSMLFWLPVSLSFSMSNSVSGFSWGIMGLWLIWVDVARRMLAKAVREK